MQHYKINHSMFAFHFSPRYVVVEILKNTFPMRCPHKVDEVHTLREVMVMLPTKGELSWQLEWLHIGPHTVAIFSKVECPVTLGVVCMFLHVLHWNLIIFSSQWVHNEGESVLTYEKLSFYDAQLILSTVIMPFQNVKALNREIGAFFAILLGILWAKMA